MIFCTEKGTTSLLRHSYEKLHNLIPTMRKYPDKPKLKDVI